jgi:hypothetical protein
MTLEIYDRYSRDVMKATLTKYIHIKSTTMNVPSFWYSPTPSLASECALHPGTKGWGAHSRAGEGFGESQFQRLEKKLSTLLLCGLIKKIVCPLLNGIISCPILQSIQRTVDLSTLNW